MAVSRITDKKNTAPKIVDFQRCMAPMGGLEPLTYRLGVPAHVSYRVVRDALSIAMTLFFLGSFKMFMLNYIIHAGKRLILLTMCRQNKTIVL